MTHPSEGGVPVTDAGRNHPPVVLATPIQWAALTGVCFAVALVSLIFARDAARVAAIWPLNAIVLAVILRSPRRRWSGVLSALLVGNAVANLVARDTPALALAYAAANVAEVAGVAHLMARRGAVRLLRKSAIIRMAWAAPAGCVLSTAIAVAALKLSGASLALAQGGVWFAADLLGLLLFTPLAWLVGGARSLAKTSADAWTAAPELWVVVASVLLVFLQSSFPLLFLVPPALVLVAFRRGLMGAAFAIIVVTVLSAGLTLAGRGPTMLIHGGLEVRVLTLQVFLVVNALMALTVGASVGEHRRILAKLRSTKMRLSARSARARRLVQQADMAETMAQLGYWTLTPRTGAVFWSPEVYRIHGVDPLTFNPELDDALAFYLDDDRAKVERQIAESLSSKTGWCFEADLRRRGGDVARVRSMAECLLDDRGEVAEIFGVFKDITADHSMLEAIKEQKALYLLLAEHSSDVIARYTAGGVLTYLSPSVEPVLGYRPDEMIGRMTYEFVHPDDAPTVKSAFRTGVETGKSISVEYRAQRKDGSYVWLEARPTASFDEAGACVGFVDTARDVTERRERELALAQARTAAEGATRAKADFLSNMSHEIRTPLNGVLGFADLLAKTPMSAEQRRHLDRIVSAGGSLLHVVNDILDFSKIEAGQMVLEHRPYDPRQLIDEVIDLIAAAHPGRGLAFGRPAPSNLGALYFGDETRIRQVLTNIVGNAAKFTRQGRVAVETVVVGDQLCITVADTGPGIPPDRLQHVFEGFSQADSSISRQFGGSGLGLSISRSLARLMGGDLTLDSQLGQGSTATLWLPARPATPAADDRVAPSEAAAGESLDLMLVDDVEMNRELLEIGLGQAGHRVESFASAVAAIDALRAGRRYDLILMDVQMPGMDGLAAARIIRQLPGDVARTPMVALTANVLDNQVAACRDAGMDDHVGKPIRMPSLLAVIAGLRLRQADRAAFAPDANPALDALRLRYAGHLASLPEQLMSLLAKPGNNAKAVKAMAHAIAGTAGSFGFAAISDAAFALESVCHRSEAGEIGDDGLPDAVESLIATIRRAS